ncbi:DUF4214 domain-containing protein [Massilia sp. YIM B02443]|uniref:DUF4214 domain-containing protein n=1 Tax=Massilia sp. YIM B02443 TaxID=3050127 RepID=UPI0025B6EF70|nr:DUF4214 domain-containing protein [Massilia sp. YIM B02443]MDN4037567.1 DUF4214 domain-containing protein [Massilia sp. YIM B02443]
MSLQSNYVSTIQSAYLAFYGRPADPEGLAFWSAALAANNGNFSAISVDFAHSAETQVRFGDAASTVDRITDIYQNLFNRAPDAEGLAFWSDAVDNGHLSMAELSLSIMQGARGDDLPMAALRLQAVESFTAQVEASGSDYAGYPAIEAARVLVRAVTLDASATDIADLVDAAVSFAATATNTPAVVDALASGGALLALYDTVRGTGDPVALTQTLADTAAAAAGNPATLDSLLRGGGMTKVLQVMPSDASLQDVVDALASGGLPAAVEVVYPTQPVSPTVPVSGVELSFVSVTEGPLDAKPDNVTNQAVADVTFSYTGKGLSAGQQFEYSIDGGKSWIDTGIDVVPETGMVVIKDLALGGKGDIELLPLRGQVQDAATVVMLRAADASGAGATISQAIVYDSAADAPQVALAHPGAGNALFTNDATLLVTGTEANAKIEYQELSFVTQNAWSTSLPQMQDGEHTVLVRQTDAAGNVSSARAISFTLDTGAPAAPAVTLAHDTGIYFGDGITAAGQVSIANLETGPGTAWEYSLDGGDKWLPGGANDGSGKATLPLTGDGAKTVLVRQIDAAGNPGEVSKPLSFTLDTSVPAIAITFEGVDGADAAGSNATEATTADVHFSYAADLPAGYYVEWRVGEAQWAILDGSQIDTGARTITIPDVALDTSDPTVELRLVTPAGSRGEIVSQPIDGPFGNIVPTLELAPGAGGVSVTSNVAGDIYLTSTEGDVQVFSNDPGMGAINGTVLVGAQQDIVSGSFKVVPQDGDALRDTGGGIYTLGTSGDDVAGDSAVWGFGGNDTLTGTAGDDTLVGGKGADILTGGAGHDAFVIAASGDSTQPLMNNGVAVMGGMDSITDFDAADDLLVFAPGTLYADKNGMTVSTTFYASLEDMLTDASAHLRNYQNEGGVFAGQVGRDVYVAALGTDAPPSYGFVGNSSPLVKLENVSVLDLTLDQIGGVSGELHYSGNGTVADDAKDLGLLQAESPLGAVYLRGLAGNDIIEDSAQDDVIIGGAGGDDIYLSGGADILVVGSGTDSNLASITAMMERSYDVVETSSGDAFTFDFGFAVQGVGATEMPMPQGGGADGIWAAINSGYDSAAHSRYDAVLMNIEGSDFLIVNNGDDVIDANDIGILIVGSGNITLDTFGNVVYTPYVDNGAGIPGDTGIGIP